MKFIKLLIVMMLMALPVFSQTGMPSITVTEAEKEFTLPIKRASIDVKIVGSLAITTYDIHFYNPNKRTLEGQLDFPLADGVVVSRFAMDVNKKLREGVIVEKAKGRQTFEKIVKRRVDPGLIEVTRGNNFRSRVYPLLPKQEKHIVIAYEEELKVTPDGLKYSLPLDMPNKLDEFSFKATIYSDFVKPINNSTNGSKFRHKDDSYTLLSEYTNYKAKELYEFIIPYFGEQSVQLETYNNEDFFRISLNPDMMLKAKEKPQTISILWDISASRLNSDIDKDLELLEEYLEYNKCNVELVPFSLYADDPSYFPNVDFHELKTNIDGLRIDGATNYSSVDISKLRGDEIFIFSDGIDNIGEGGFGDTEKTMYIINSSSISDHDACRKLAQKTGGKYINLIDENTESALNLLTYNFPYFMGIDGAASEVYPNNAVVKGNINISGKLLSSSQLKLKFGYGNKVAKIIPINITEANRTNSGILHKIWAKQKLADLNFNQTQNETEITELGKKYSLVTAFTSLIVLETAWDYYGYKIDPPEELREEYDSVATAIEEYYAKWQINLTADSLEYLKYFKEKLLDRVNEMRIWYNLDFKEDKYLDSCYKIIDQKVGKLLECIDYKDDSKPYYVINLKELLPNFDFSKRKYLNYKFLKNRDDSYNSFYGSLDFRRIYINDTYFHIHKSYYYGLEKFSNIDVTNFQMHKTNKNDLTQLVFEANSYKYYKYGLDPKYEGQTGIELDSSSCLRIEISSKDLSEFYNKLYVIKEGAYYLSKENKNERERSRLYAKKVNQVVKSAIKDMEEIPNEELYTTVDLDSLLPEFKDLNHQHFKYIDLSQNKTFHNKLNDSIYNYKYSNYEYFYDASQFLDSNKMMMAARSYTSTIYNKIPYWEDQLCNAIDLKILNKSRIDLDALYLVSSLSFDANKEKIREKYKDKISNISGNMAIKISDHLNSLDLSKVYLFKNISMVVDNKAYLENITSQYLSRINNRIFSIDSRETFDQTETLLTLVPMDKIIPKWVSEKEKALRIAIYDSYQFEFEVCAVDSVILYSENVRLNANMQEVNSNYYNAPNSKYIFYTAKDLLNKNMTTIDSILVKFSLLDSTIVLKEKESGILRCNADSKHFSYTVKNEKLQNYNDNFIVLNAPKFSYKTYPEKSLVTYRVENLYVDINISEFSLKGKVTDCLGNPLPGATVLIGGIKKGAKTKPDGRFIIKNIPLSHFVLKVTYIGKVPKIIRYVRSDSCTNLNIQLEDRVTMTQSVIITKAKRSKFDEEAFYKQNAGFEIYDNTENSNSIVELSSYQSSKEYYKTLSSVALGELKDTYFELRKSNQLNPSFFFDAAKVFEKQGKIKEACRVMSNLAEINLEDHENLRRVGGFLMEHKEYALAKSIYKHILKIRSEEPQSFRDYALCLAESGEYQSAADSLYNLFTRNIAWSYKGIMTTLITDFNTLLTKYKSEIDITKYDSKYIFKTYMDLRIEISWIMDGINIDLLVIEPDSTFCNISYQYSKNGGLVVGSNPEVYMIKNAIPGTYKIKAQYKSNRRQKSSLEPQVRCKIYTNYGRPEQKLQENVIKIEIDKGEVDLGEVVIE